MGIKRLSVPRRILEKFPIRIYVPEPPSSTINTTTQSPPHSPHPTQPTSQPPRTPPRYTTPSPPLPPSPTVAPRRRRSQDGRRHQLSHDTTLQRGYSQSQCPICLEDFVAYSTTVRELPCLHVFHPECIDPFLETQSSLCPLCKVSALPRGYVPPQLTNATVRRERNLRRMRARVDAGGGGVRWWWRFVPRGGFGGDEDEDREIRSAAREAPAVEMVGGRRRPDRPTVESPVRTPPVDHENGSENQTKCVAPLQ